MNQVRINIHDGGKGRSVSLSLPEKWDELGYATYPFAAELFMLKDEGVSKYDLGIKALILLSETREDKNLLFTRILKAEEAYELLKLVDWLFEKCDVIKNHLPYLKLKRANLFLGPDDGLKNLRFAEWLTADTAFVDYCHNKDEASLNQLIAALYRPKGKGAEFIPGNPLYRGDQREKFNDALLERRAMEIGKLPIWLKKAIFLWFASCRQQLVAAYPKVLDSGEENDNSLLSGFGWFGIYDDLRADPKYAGDPQLLEEEYIHTLFQSLTRTRLKMDDIKRQNR